jgi:hypothetical protein
MAMSAGSQEATIMLEQQMIGRVRINYLPGCISADEVEAALARISTEEANVFAHEALEGCSLTLIWTNRAAAVLNAPISGILRPSRPVIPRRSPAWPT